MKKCIGGTQPEDEELLLTTTTTACPPLLGGASNYKIHNDIFLVIVKNYLHHVSVYCANYHVLLHNAKSNSTQPDFRDFLDFLLLGGLMPVVGIKTM